MENFLTGRKTIIAIKKLRVLLIKNIPVLLSYALIFLFIILHCTAPLFVFEAEASNVLSNPSFTGNTTGWTLSKSGNSTTIAYDSTAYQDSAGSVKVTTSGRNKTGTSTTIQLTSTVTAGSLVYLNFYYNKSCGIFPPFPQTNTPGCDINTIEVRIKPTNGTQSVVWSDTSTSDSSGWVQVSDINISSYFTTTDTYTLTFYTSQDTLANSYAANYINVDNINLDVTSPSITVGNTGTQTSSIQQGTSNVYLGGAFTFVRNTGSTSVTSITVSETGTISDSNISGLILYYKQEATCSTSIPSGTTQFNSTAGTFSSGSSTVTGTMSVGTSQICVYVEVDIGSGAQANDTVEIQITNPSTQITASAGSVSPSTAVAISGSTTITAVSNTAPSFTNFTQNGPIDPGSTITFTSTASDPDANNITMVVCKTSGVAGNACDGGANDTWCTSSAASSNPSCQYTTSSVSPDGSFYAYPYVFDSYNVGATGAYQGMQASFSINNTAPIVSSVSINSGFAISLLEASTQDVVLAGTVTDSNSCYGGEIQSVKAFIYRSGIGYSGCDTSLEWNDSYCYPNITCTVVAGSCTDNTDASANYRCTVSLQYFADPTDTGTMYPGENWKCTIAATDNNGTSATFESSSGVEVSSLIAFSTTFAINYGVLGPDQSNNPLDRTITVTPTGNVGLDQELSGATMCKDYPTCAQATIAIGYQRYSLAESTPYSSGTSLTTTPTEVELNVPKVVNGEPISKYIWLGLYIPGSTTAGSYNGSITVTGIKGEPTDW